MVRLTSPNGVEVRVDEGRVPSLLALGYARADGKAEKKAAPGARRAGKKE